MAVTARCTTITAALLLLASSLRAAPPEISPEARAILDKAVQGMGGEAALSRVEKLRMSIRGTYQSGPISSPYTSETTLAFPDCVLWEMDMVDFKASMGVDAGAPWSQFMAPPARLKGAIKESLLEWILHYKAMLVEPLLEQEDIKISVARPREGKKAGKNTGKKSGKKAAPAVPGIRLELPSGRRLVLGFAARGETLRLATIRGDVLLMDGRKARVQVRLTRPKRFGDITFPSIIDSRTLCDGKLVETMHEEVIAIDWSPEVKEGAFRMPEFDKALLNPRVKTTEPVKGLMMVHQGPYDEMGTTIEKLKTAAQEAELHRHDSYVAIYLNNPNMVKDPSELRTEIILPVMMMGPPPEKLPEGMSVKELPAAEVASKMARGEYGKADVQALMDLFAFIGTEGLQPAGSPRMVYFHDPEATVVEDLTTEVQIPVQER